MTRKYICPVCINKIVEAIDRVMMPSIIANMVESGLDDLDNLGHLGLFLVGQVGLIHKQNYLDVTRISHVL